MDRAAWLIAAAIYIAVLYSLVRPNSKGAGIVMVISNTFADLIRGIAGESYDSANKTWNPA